MLSIDASNYPQAFDAALEAARSAGMPAAFQDRRAGIIETEPDHAATLLEPWAFQGQTLEQLTENTLSSQRRRARFEFTPVDEFSIAASEVRVPSENELTGPDLLATEQVPIDLTRWGTPLELRVWVYVERQHRPGVRRSTWTRSKTTQMELTPKRGEGEEAGQPSWLPVARDPAFERRLLTAIQADLQLELASPP